MSFIPHTPADRRIMLEQIGVRDLEELFEDVPEQHRFPELDLPPAISELELEQEMAELAGSNRGGLGANFLGAGAYSHYRPATVDSVLRRGELYSAYTPYQPEISQGMLQAMFEYQSMVCALTGMAVSTASHYDGGTALAEAVLVALAATSAERREIVVMEPLNPRYRAVLETYLRGADAELIRADQTSLEREDLFGASTAACVVQSPNFFGQFEPVTEIAEAVHEQGALLIVMPDPIALGLFRSPGESGADLVAMDGQPLGIPRSFGGPSLGVLAATAEQMRRLPGRLVGETVDANGDRGYVLTLSTREQHIRREKALSNICTNAALMALAAATYLATLGKVGLRQIANLCYQKSHYAAARLSDVPGCSINPQAPEKAFFKELVLRLPRRAAEVNQILLRDHDIVGGFELAQDGPDRENDLLLAFTETCSKADIDRLVDAVAQITSGGSTTDDDASEVRA